MAGIKVQKNYVSSNASNVNLANNWSVLVLGVARQGPLKPTLVQSYSEFTSTFGESVIGAPTHNYVQYLLNNGVPVVFYQIAESNDLISASSMVKDTSNAEAIQFTSTLLEGAKGNSLCVSFTSVPKTDGNSGNQTYMMISEAVTQDKTTTYNIKELVKVSEFDAQGLFIKASLSTIKESKYVATNILNKDYTDLGIKAMTFTDESKVAVGNSFVMSDLNTAGGQPTTYTFSDGSGNVARTLEEAVAILKNPESKFWTKDKRLKNAMTYFPQVRFVTTGGIIASDTTTTNPENQNKVLTNLGVFAVNCGTSFRVLMDYDMTTQDVVSVVRNFATTTTTANPSQVYAYFGNWGNTQTTQLPGSAGFLAALGRAGYNVYNRRIAGTSFNPGFVSSYNELYIDSVDDWQNEDKVQLNPIVNIDSRDNLAVMGSSTLAVSQPTGAKNPAQALDIVLVGDYVAALLNNIALTYLESTLDRLMLSSLSNEMSKIVNGFVTSNAITRYNFDFDVSQLGKLNINCTLYFVIGLEEVALTITSAYDTEVVA